MTLLNEQPLNIVTTSITITNVSALRFTPSSTREFCVLRGPSFSIAIPYEQFDPLIQRLALASRSRHSEDPQS